MSTIGRKKRVAVEIGGGGSVLSVRALADDDEPNVVEVEYVPVAQLQGAAEALAWIAQFTSDHGDARMMAHEQARNHIHRRASAALEATR
jgi:gamma-glutamyl phosphate reductase